MNEWQQKMDRFGSAGRIVGLSLIASGIVVLLVIRGNSQSSVQPTEMQVGFNPTSVSVETALTAIPRPSIILDDLTQGRKTLEVGDLQPDQNPCQYVGDPIQVQGYIKKRSTSPDLMSNPYVGFNNTEVTVYDLFANSNGDSEPVEVRIEDDGFVYKPFTRVSIVGGVLPDETNGKKDYCYVIANSIKPLTSK